MPDRFQNAAFSAELTAAMAEAFDMAGAIFESTGRSRPQLEAFPLFAKR